MTKRGTNQWRGDARYLSTEGNWQATPDDIFVPNPSPGHTAPGSSIDGVKEYGFNIGGPLMADHLWIWGSYGESDIRNIIGAAQEVGKPINLDHTKLKDTNVKLNFQTTTSNSGTVHYWDNNKLKFGRSGNWNRPVETTWDQTTPATKWRLEDTQLFGSTFMLSGMYSNNDGGFTLHPKGGNNDVYQDDDGIWHGSFWVFDQTGTVEQAKIDGTNFVNTGGWDNELKYGASYRTQENDSASVLPTGDAVISCAWIGCADETQSVVEWSRYHPSVKTKYAAMWAQDTISKDRWTITGGLRYDRQTATNKAVNDPGVPAAPNGLLPPINFKGDDAQGLDWSTLVPRVGVTYAAGEDRHTLLRGSFSQYGAQLGQWVANYVSPTGSYSYVYYYFTDANSNHKFDPNEAGSLTYYYYLGNINTLDPTKSPNRLAKDFKPYKTNELSLSVQHSFPSNFNVSANAVFRKTTDLLYARDLLVDGSGTLRPAVAYDYVANGTVTGVLPDGTSVTVPKYKLPGATGGHELSNSDREIDYMGLTLGFQKPMASHWSLRGNFTYGDNKLKVGSKFKSQDNPENRISLGSGYYGDTNDIFVETSYGSHALVLINSRWSFNVNGLYQVAPDRVWGFDVAASVSGREGFPYAPSDNTNVRGRELAKLGDFRLPSVISLDARLAKDVKIQDFTLTFSLDGFNLLNSQPSLQRYPKAPKTVSDLGTAYSSIENLSPRVYRWGVAMHFR